MLPQIVYQLSNMIKMICVKLFWHRVSYGGAWQVFNTVQSLLSEGAAASVSVGQHHNTIRIIIFITRFSGVFHLN